MPEPNPQALEFLMTRRSRPAKTLGERGPEQAELMRLLTAAARVPDHKKLEPWRFVVIEGAARDRLAGLAAERLRATGRGTKVEKEAGQFRQGAVIVAVVSRPQPHDDVPEWEQQMSAACVCLGLVNAALASGWGAQWLTGPLVRDREFLGALGCEDAETVAGFVHIGDETVAPSERDRPDVEAITTWA